MDLQKVWRKGFRIFRLHGMLDYRLFTRRLIGVSYSFVKAYLARALIYIFPVFRIQTRSKGGDAPG
jgi:hypothetical protein